MIKDPEVKRKWIEALRSGKYKQGYRSLHKEDTFCCLGVQLDAAGCEWKNSFWPIFSVAFINNEEIGTTTWSHSYCNKIGLTEQEMIDLFIINDRGETFVEIADYIEKNL